MSNIKSMEARRCLLNAGKAKPSIDFKLTGSVSRETLPQI